MLARASVLVSLALVIACGGRPGQRPEAKSVTVAKAQAAEEEPTRVAETSTKSGDVVTVRLLKPGAEPRSPLRLKFEKGATETMIMVMRMRTTSSVAGGDTTTLLPDMVEHLRMRVSDVQPNGSARVEFVVEKAVAKDRPGVAPMVVSAVDTALQGMVGMKGYSIVTDRAVVEDGDVEVPPNAPQTLVEMADQMRESLTQFANPVPEEPVGIGAQWEVTTYPRSSGVRVTQKAIQTLVSRNGMHIETKTTVASSAEPQPMKSNKLPPGARADVKSLEVRGSGGASWSLDHLVPARSKVKVRSELHATLSLAEDSVPMKAEAEIEIALTRGP
jgi:hypothetical protein